MSLLEVLPACSPTTFEQTLSETYSFSQPCLQLNQSDIDELINSAQSQKVPLNDLIYDNEGYYDSDFRISSLPPVLRGHPGIHLREGVINASRLAEEHQPDSEKAFFVADLSAVYRQFKRWRQCLPEVEPFYAVKCNPDPYVLRLLAALGTGFDCASNGEIQQVLDLGLVDPSRIIFANPCKASSFIRSAAKAGVDVMTFDNSDELYKIARIHSKAKLVIRILTDDSKSLCRLGLKFGAPLSTVYPLLAKAKELGLDVIGVSFHVGSGCYDSNAFSDAIKCARTAFEIAADVGYNFTLLDVGGGFEDADFESNASVLSDAIDQYFPRSYRHTIKIIAEPGRFFVSKAFKLAANVIARRAPLTNSGTIKPKSEDVSKIDVTESKIMYYINDGVYGAFNCILFDHQKVQPYVLCLNGSFHIPPQIPLSLSSVWGPTCDSIDCVCPLTQLPVDLSVGDWLGFDDMGAYTICAASQFNGFKVSEVIYTSGEGVDSAGVRRALSAFAPKD